MAGVRACRQVVLVSPARARARGVRPLRHVCLAARQSPTPAHPPHPSPSAPLCPQLIAEVSKGLGDAMSGTGNIKESQVAFRERGL